MKGYSSRQIFKFLLIQIIWFTGLAVNRVNAQEVNRSQTLESALANSSNAEEREILQQAFSVVNNLRPIFQRVKSDEDKWSAAVPQKVIAHIKGSKGRPLKIVHPEAASIISSELIPNVPAIPGFEDKLRDGTLFQNDEIPICNSSKSEFEPVKNLSSKDPDTTVLIDNLYLDENFLSDNRLNQDVRDLFSPEVVLTKYDRGETSAVNGIIKAAGIPCLPYRIRMTTRGLWKLHGREALKQFEDPKSRGRFHPSVVEVIRRLR